MDEAELLTKLIATWENQIVELKKQKASAHRNWLISLCQKIILKTQEHLDKLNQT